MIAVKKTWLEIITILSIILISFNTPSTHYYIYPQSNLGGLVKSSVSKSMVNVQAQVTYTIPLTQDETQSSNCVELKLNTKKTVENVTVTLFVLEQKPNEIPEPEGKVSFYIQLECDNIGTDEGEVEITFRVGEDWVEANNIDKEQIKMLRYTDGKWIELETKYIGVENGHLIFSAHSPGLSLFAVVGYERATLPWATIFYVSAAALVALSLFTYVYLKRKG